MFFYDVFSFNWFRTFVYWCWAIWRRLEWRNGAFRNAAKPDSALDDTKEGIAELPAHPPFLQAALNYFQLQHSQAVDWFTYRYHPLDKVRRGMQQSLAKVNEHHAVAKANLAHRMEELKESTARYMAHFDHEPAYRPQWMFAVAFSFVLILASIDAPVIYKSLTPISDAAWMLYLLTLGVVGLLLFAGHAAGMWWHSNRRGSVAVTLFALGFIVITALIRQGTMSSQVKELFPNLPVHLFPVFFVCLQAIVLLAAAVVAHYIHEPLRLDFDRKTRGARKAAKLYHRIQEEKTNLVRKLEMMEPRMIHLDQEALSHIDFIRACAEKKRNIYNRTYEHNRKNFKTAVPKFLARPFEFIDPDVIKEIRERERQRREAAEKKAAVKSFPKEDKRDAA